MITFKSFLKENTEQDYHHTSGSSINTEKHNAGKGENPEHPVWLSHDSHQAKGWHNRIKDNEGSAHTYKVAVKGKIARHDDPEVKALLKKHGHDSDDYHSLLASNPSPKEVHEHPATKTLQKHGYVGYTHPDYDPHNDQKDHDSTVVFNRKNTQLSKPSSEKAKEQKEGDHVTHNVGNHEVQHQTHQHYTGTIAPTPLAKTRSVVKLSDEQASKLKTAVHKKDGNEYKHTKKKDGVVAYVTHDNEKSRQAFHKALSDI